MTEISILLYLLSLFVQLKTLYFCEENNAKLFSRLHQWGKTSTLFLNEVKYESVRPLKCTKHCLNCTIDCRCQVGRKKVIIQLHEKDNMRVLQYNLPHMLVAIPYHTLLQLTR
jgi:hypothetical protein